MNTGMKRILIFSLAYVPFVGGAEIALKELTDRLGGEYKFHLVTLRFKREWPVYEKLGEVHVHRVGGGTGYLSKVLFVPLAAREGARLHRMHRFDLAWAMMSFMLFPILLMRARPSYVLTLQEGDPFERVFKRPHIAVFLPLLRRGFRGARVVQVISTFLGGWARQMGFDGSLEVIPNGVDTQHFARPIAPAPRERVREEFGVGERNTLLVTSSRLVHKNAVDNIIRAIALLPEDTHFLVLGEGPDRKALEELARELEVEKRVHFKGHIDHAQLPYFLHASDIFVRPSRSEGMGNSFIEAFAAELPVIATKEGGIADFLFDSEQDPDQTPTGFAVPKDSPADIAEAVKKIQTNPELVRRVVANAKTLAFERYDWNTLAEEMDERVFKKALS